MKRLPIMLMFLLIALSAFAQLQPIELPEYDFIQYEKNVLHYDSTSLKMKRMFEKWHRIEKTHQGNMNIVHIGSSHVQGGSLPNTIRCNIMTSYPQLVANRGMIFPYSAAAKCNNPADYKIHCPQKVRLTRNVYNDLDYALGLCGIAVTAFDTVTEVQVVMNEPRVDYATNRVVIIGSSPQNVIPRISMDGRVRMPSYIDRLSERFVFNLEHPTDSFSILIPCEINQSFTLNGIYLGNGRSGFSYHSIGVNGASLADYLKCTHFTRDLRLLHPDVVVFGIGINDAVPADFDTVAFRQKYLQLVDSVRSVNPDCAFIFVTNNDSFIRKGRRKYVVNSNGAVAREVFYRLAQETDGAVWDQFEVMGGLKSMDKWRKDKLAQTDRVHFTAAGYRLIGNLFSNALFDAVNKYKPYNPNQQSGGRYQYISY